MGVAALMLLGHRLVHLTDAAHRTAVSGVAAAKAGAGAGRRIILVAVAGGEIGCLANGSSSTTTLQGRCEVGWFGVAQNLKKARQDCQLTCHVYVRSPRQFRRERKLLASAAFYRALHPPFNAIIQGRTCPYPSRIIVIITLRQLATSESAN